MGTNQAFAVAPLAERNSELRVLNADTSQLPQVVLDETFVDEVRKAYANLDLTHPDDARIVHAVWARLLGLPVVQNGSREEIRDALIYLATAGAIMLPCEPEELECE